MQKFQAFSPWGGNGGATKITFIIQFTTVTFGLAMDSNLNTLGMLLLCGMFKNVSLPSLLTIASRLGSKVAVAAPEEPKGESYLVQGETPAELPVPEKPADAGAGD